MDAIVFGAFVKERRILLGMTQAELAQQLHVTAKAVSRWERGVGFPDIHTLEPLAAALDVTLLELMQSRVLPDDAVSSGDASAAVADALSFAGAKKLGWILKWLDGISLAVMIAAEFFLLAVFWKFVTVPWMRAGSMAALWLVASISGFLYTLRRLMESPKLPTRRQIVSWCLTALGLILFLTSFFLRELVSRSAGNLARLLGLALVCIRDWTSGSQKS